MGPMLRFFLNAREYEKKSVAEENRWKMRKGKKKGRE